jgi:peptidoglycan/xylan/chitin deacetylase (PgdA/CDA1 family)
MAIPAFEYARRGLAGWALVTAGRHRQNRAAYGPTPGLRLAGLHAEDTDDIDAFTRLIERCAAAFPTIGPRDVDAVAEGKAPAADSLGFTFDDGHRRTFDALAWMTSQRLYATIFVIPSYIGRSARQYLAYHERRGVAAFNIAGDRDPDRTLGLTPSQLRELESMGHRIGGHNDAHRDLGALDDAGAAYEIDAGLDQLEDLLGHHVDDFAWAVGGIRHAPAPALERASRRCRRVYSSVRGLNVPGVSPAILLRDHISIDFPPAFNLACLRGAFDARYKPARRQLAETRGLLPSTA